MTACHRPMDLLGSSVHTITSPVHQCEAGKGRRRELTSLIPRLPLKQQGEGEPGIFSHVTYIDLDAINRNVSAHIHRYWGVVVTVSRSMLVMCKNIPGSLSLS